MTTGMGCTGQIGTRSVTHASLGGAAARRGARVSKRLRRRTGPGEMIFSSGQKSRWFSPVLSVLK